MCASRLTSNINSRRPHHRQQEVNAIQPLLTKYKISEADLEALLTWRHSHDF